MSYELQVRSLWNEGRWLSEAITDRVDKLQVIETREMPRTQLSDHLLSLDVRLISIFQKKLSTQMLIHIKWFVSYITANMHLIIVEIFFAEVGKRYLPNVGISTFTFEHDWYPTLSSHLACTSEKTHSLIKTSFCHISYCTWELSHIWRRVMTSVFF